MRCLSLVLCGALLLPSPLLLAADNPADNTVQTSAGWDRPAEGLWINAAATCSNVCDHDGKCVRTLLDGRRETWYPLWTYSVETGRESWVLGSASCGQKRIAEAR